MRLSPGARVGPYEVVSVLGTGGMGEVYLARDARLDRRVAIKARQLSPSATADDRQRVLHEGRAAARLSHPGIAPVFDVIEDGETSYLVMEYVEGRTLRALIADGPLPLGRAVGLGLELCHALASAHAHGVVHGDVKPENICITPDGRLKVLDFGIARIASTPGHVHAPTQTGDSAAPLRFAGTPQYAAPEQFEGKHATIASDIYSAAAVTYEMLTGRPPFLGRDALEIGLQVLRADAPRADAVQACVPPGIADVLAQGLAREASQRPDSAEALAQALTDAYETDRATRNTPSSGRVALLTPPAARPTRRRRALAVAAAVLVLAASVGAWALWKRGGLHPSAADAHAPPIIAVLPLESVGPERGHAYLGTGIADSLIANLASVPGITVVARSSSAALAGARGDLRRVARELGASFVVDGSVQTEGTSVRVSLTLVRADASVAWGRSFDGQLDRVFDLYQQVAEGLAEGLTLRLSPPERERMGRPATLDIDALAEYSAAQERLARADLVGNVAQAVDGFQRALARDPSFALAYAGLSEAHLADYNQTGNGESLQRALVAARRAAELAPYQAQALVSLGQVYVTMGQLAEARQSFEHAIALQPADDDAYRGLAMAQAGSNARDGARAAFEKTLEIRPGFWRNHHEYGRFLYGIGKYDDAAAQFRQVVELLPDSPRGYQALGTVFQTQGRIQEAIAEYQKAAAIGPSVNLFLNLGTAEHWEGHYGEAVAAFEQAAGLAPDDPVPVRNMGDSRLGMGDAPGARAAYEQSLLLVERQLRNAPASASLQSLRAVLLAKLGRHAEASRAMQQVLADHAGDADALYSGAVVLALAGKTAEAAPALDAAFAAGASRELADRDDDLAGVRQQLGRRFSEQADVTSTGGSR